MTTRWAVLLVSIVCVAGCEERRDQPVAAERSAVPKNDEPPSVDALCTQWVRFIDEDMQRMMNVPKDATEAAIAKDAAECKTIAEAGRAKNEAIYADCAKCVVASRDVHAMEATCSAVCDQLMAAGGARPVPKTPTALPKGRAR